jgi:hypothetical protein
MRRPFCLRTTHADHPHCHNHGRSTDHHCVVFEC